MFQGVIEEERRRSEEEQTVHQEGKLSLICHTSCHSCHAGPGGLPEPAGEELPPVHGVPQAPDTAGGGPGKHGVTWSQVIVRKSTQYYIKDF